MTTSDKGRRGLERRDEALNSLGKQICECTPPINSIKQKEQSGLAIDDEIQKRQQLEEERYSLQLRYDSTYDSMMQGNYQTEEKLTAIERQMTKKQGKPNDVMRNYATNQIEEEARKSEVGNQRGDDRNRDPVG